MSDNLFHMIICFRVLAMFTVEVVQSLHCCVELSGMTPESPIHIVLHGFFIALREACELDKLRNFNVFNDALTCMRR